MANLNRDIRRKNRVRKDLKEKSLVKDEAETIVFPELSSIIWA